MKKTILTIALGSLAFFSPLFAYSHVKWFTNIEPQKESIENILSPLFLLLAVLVALILAILPQILPKLEKWNLAQKADNKLSKMRKYTFLILKYGTALSLIIQVFNGNLFAPEIHIERFSISVLVWVTITFLLIPHHLFTKLGSLLMITLFLFVTSYQEVFHMLDYGFYLAIAGTLLVQKTKVESLGFPILYLGTGLSLCWVAVEKWVYPRMALDIIYQHQVPTFGFNESIFISLTAFIEFVVGYLLVVGILNRLLGLVVTLIFFSTTLLFGATEVIGHFMIHIILITFIIEGVSFYKPPIKIHKSILDQMIFVFLNFIFVLSTFILIYYRFA